MPKLYFNHLDLLQSRQRQISPAFFIKNVQFALVYKLCHQQVRHTHEVKGKETTALKENN